MPVELRSFLENNCLSCHDEDTKEAGLDLNALAFGLNDRSSFDRWVRVHDKVKKGDMPPKGNPQPDSEARHAFVEALARSLTEADRVRQSDRGRTIVRRLNRTEYENSISKLFDMPVGIRDMLPPDATRCGFDTVGDALNVSAVQMESYLEALDSVLDSATTLYEQPERKKYRLSYLNAVTMMQVGRKNQPASIRPDGVAMFATEKMSHFHTLLDQYTVPHDGRYKVRVSAYAIQSNEPITLTVRAGGSGHKESLEVPHKLLRNADVHPGNAQVIEWDGWLQRGHFFHVYPSLRPMRFIGDLEPDDYQGPGVVVQWIEVDGPIFDQWPPVSHERLWAGVPLKKNGAEANEDPNAQLDGPPQRNVVLKIPVKGKRDKEGRMVQQYVDRPKELIYKQAQRPDPLKPTLALAPRNAKSDCVRLVRSFAQAAFRSPVSSAQLKPYIDLAHRWLDEGQSFEDSMRTAYKAILTSPEFLYFRKPTSKLDDFALAERLAYFLTRRPADRELLALAASGKLSTPETLRIQTERLLNDSHSQKFIDDFAGQWLDLRLIDFTAPDSDLYPEFDPVLQWSMVEETRAFVRELVEKNLPVRSVVDSDFAMLNGHLAKLYQIRGVQGAEIRRVELPKDSLRGGVLSQASVLKVTANGTSTSPVVRGKWVLERILGTPPPPPPPGVPAIEPDIRGATTVLEQLVQHRSIESCAACHREIDPPGVALECFDVMGAYRERYRALDPNKADVKVRYGPEAPPVQKYRDALPVVASDVLVTGEQFKDFHEFKRILADQPERLASNVVEKLILFSTGADISFADRVAVQQIVATTKAESYGFRSLIHAVVQSALFARK